MEPSEHKKAYREQLKTTLSSLPEPEQRSQVLLQKLKKKQCLEGVGSVSIFVSLPDEVKTLPIVEYCWQQGIRVLVPERHHTSRGEQIDFREWNEHDELMEVHHGIQHPRSGGLFTRSVVDVVFVPGLAFTPDGKRLGRGMGFYDRLLSQFEGRSIGLCFEEQIKKAIPTEEHDQQVDDVVSC